MTIRSIAVLLCCLVFLGCEESGPADAPAPAAPAITDARKTSMFAASGEVADALQAEADTIRRVMQAEPILSQALADRAGTGLINIILEGKDFSAMADSASAMWSYNLTEAIDSRDGISILKGQYGSGMGDESTPEVWMLHKQVKLGSGKADLILVYEL